VFVRSGSLKPRSWYRTFLEEPVGTIQVGEREVPVRAVRTRSERLKAAVDRAYLEKYKIPMRPARPREICRPSSLETEILLAALQAA